MRFFGPVARYEHEAADPDHIKQLSDRHSVGQAVAEVLVKRGLGTKSHDELSSWLDPRLAHLTPPDAMLDRGPAVDRLGYACRRRERVVVFGDYDVDGTTSAAILCDALEAMGASVRPLVANRFKGGYGFSDEGLEQALALRPDLIVTCDCGSSDHPRIEAARKKGVDVVVVDHHLVPDEVLPANAFLNPHRPECGFPFKGLCSAGLALSLIAGVRRDLGSPLDLRPFLDLVALGTVADVMPLERDNRALVRFGLRVLSSGDRPGVVALREAARIKRGAPVTASDIGFRFGPRLNAAGRLADATLTLKLLRSRNLYEARQLAAEIERINTKRKKVTEEVTHEAIEQALEIYGPEPTTGVVLAKGGWHPGVVGITAARVAERFGVPAIVIGIEGKKARGSGRRVGEFDLHAAIKACRSDLVRFGGHAAAAGVTLDKERLEAFRASFSDASKGSRFTESAPTVDVEIGEGRAVPSAMDLVRLEPLGEANEQPLFALKDARVESVKEVGDGHGKVALKVGGLVLNAFARSLISSELDLPSRGTIMGTLSPDNYRGVGVDMQICGWVA